MYIRKLLISFEISKLYSVLSTFSDQNIISSNALILISSYFIMGMSLVAKNSMITSFAVCAIKT